MSDTMDVIIHDKQTLHKGHLTLNRYQLQHSLFAGGYSEIITRDVLERGMSAAVLLHDPERDCVVLVEQFRIGMIHSDHPWGIELVAGMIEDGHSVVETQCREVEEETGATAHDFEQISAYYTSAGGSTEVTYIAYAQIDSSAVAAHAGLDTEHEDIRVVVMPVADFIALASKPEQPMSASLIIAAQWLEKHKH